MAANWKRKRLWRCQWSSSLSRPKLAKPRENAVHTYHSEVSRHLRAQPRVETGGHSLSRALLLGRAAWTAIPPSKQEWCPRQQPAHGVLPLYLFYPVLPRVPAAAAELPHCGVSSRRFCDFVHSGLWPLDLPLCWERRLWSLRLEVGSVCLRVQAQLECNMVLDHHTKAQHWMWFLCAEWLIQS